MRGEGNNLLRNSCHRPHYDGCHEQYDHIGGDDRSGKRERKEDQLKDNQPLSLQNVSDRNEKEESCGITELSAGRDEIRDRTWQVALHDT